MVIKKFLTNATLILALIFASSLLAATTTPAATSLIGRQPASKTPAPIVQAEPPPSRFLPPGKPFNEPQPSEPQCKAPEVVVENSKYFLALARLSEAAYDKEQKVGTRTGLWEKIGDSASWLESKSWGFKILGFHGAVFLNERTDELAISFEGTNSVSDLITDLQGVLAGSILNPQVPVAYLLGYLYARDIIAEHPGHQIVLTGHSLGGGIAQYAGGRLAADNQRSKIIVYNSGGLYGPGIEDIFGNSGERTQIVQNHTAMVHIRVAGDSISGSGEKVAGWSPVPPQDLQWGAKTYIELPGNVRGEDHKLGHIIARLENVVQGVEPTSPTTSKEPWLYEGVVNDLRTDISFLSFLYEHDEETIKLNVTVNSDQAERKTRWVSPHDRVDHPVDLVIFPDDRVITATDGSSLFHVGNR